MGGLLPITLLVITSLLLTESGVIIDSDITRELYIYKSQVRILYDLLLAECPEEVRPKRSDVGDTPAVELEVQKLHYFQLVRQLIRCRTAKSMTTTRAPLRPECLSAANLNEFWRMDHNGSNLMAGGHRSQNNYACDSHQDLQWFRFTGAAGNKILDSCPKWRSCGTYFPYWTDEASPGAVGTISKVNVYAVETDNCRFFNRTLEVMRCSWDTDHDVIYRYADRYHDDCGHAFCGMQ